MRAPSPSLKNKRNHYWRGLLAEYVAALYLFFKGYRLRAHRYKTPVGEIDLIASRGKTLIIIEVKLRQNMDAALSAISPASQKRILNAAKWYMAQNKFHNYDTIQMDVIAIGRFSIKHLDNAWQDNP